MKPQETIYRMLAVKGDCWHIPITEKSTPYQTVVPCKNNNCDALINITGMPYLGEDKVEVNPDLTTESGAFWLLVRLPAWDRFEEFCDWLEEDEENIVYAVGDTFTWLTTDAKDGKAPALFNALVEFTGLEVEDEKV